MDRPHKASALAGLMAGLVGVGAITFAFSSRLPVNASTVGFAFLLVVLGVAAISGFRVSAIVSVSATLCFNFFFLPPTGRFTIADPANWVALFTFLLTALVASHLSDRARRQAAEAKRHQQETEQLYALSRAILLTDAAQPIGTQAAQAIAQTFASPTVVICDGHTLSCFRGGPEDVDGLEPRLHEVIRQGVRQRDDARDLDIWPIALGGNPVGALAAAGIRVSDGAVQSMLNLVAIALERVRTEQAANRAEAARQSEEFKSMLLDAMAHEFKTPLTSIKAAATGLRALGEAMRPDQEELTTVIEEETDRLSQLVTEAVKMSEIDAGKVKLHHATIPIAELLEAAKNSFSGRGSDRLEVAEGSEACLLVDRDLLVLAIRQVFDNALKYSDPGLPVNCSTSMEPGGLLLRVSDCGPGVPERDRERIFDKYYRRAGVHGRVPGSGLGLHIAREIARIHGGDLWVEATDRQGTVFCFSFPVADGVER